MTLASFDVIRRLSDGLVVAFYRDLGESYGRLLFSRAKARKVHECSRCGSAIPVGGEAYRPITNLACRWHRVCLPCVDQPATQGSEK